MVDYIELEAKLKERDIVALSKSITLNESTILEDNMIVDTILSKNVSLLDKSIVIGITGIPGVGKSSFINVLGEFLHSVHMSLAVFSIDPSSELSHGSILGDKTRMTALSSLKDVFIRPSPSSTRLGGIGINTHKNIELAKIAGYDIIFVETVGVGQSETIMKNLCDVFVLLQMPSSGDELQGIKKGIMEVADFFIIHKADGDLKVAAATSKKDIESALHLTRKEEMKNRIFSFSSLDKIGLEEIWHSVLEYIDGLHAQNKFLLKRRMQRSYWIEKEYESILFNASLEKNKEKIASVKSKTLEGKYITINDILASIQ